MFNVALNLLRQPKAESLEVSEQPVVAMSTMVEEPAGEVSKTSVENIATSEPAIETVNADSDARNTLEEIYTWIDQIPFSRPRKNIARDFSDGGTPHLFIVQHCHKNIDRNFFSCLLFFQCLWRNC